MSSTTLPLLPSGKVDRASLPNPEFEAGRDDFVRPVGATAEAVAAAYGRYLGRSGDTVSANQSFFDLGGTSLGAVAIAADLGERLGREVPIAWLFTCATVADLADRLDHGPSTEYDTAENDIAENDIAENDTAENDTDALATVVAFSGDRARTPLFCVHPVSGLAWCYAGLAPHLPDTTLYGLQATRLRSMPHTIGEFAALYIERVRAVQPDGPYHLLGWSVGGTIAHEMAVQLRESGC